jgi:hypothetical protein
MIYLKINQKLELAYKVFIEVEKSYKFGRLIKVFIKAEKIKNKEGVLAIESIDTLRSEFD